MTDFVYTRPNQYHSNLIFEKAVSGQQCSKEEISSLKAWILARALMHKNANLYFLVNNDLTELKKLLNMLCERRLFPNVSVCFSNSDLCEQIGDLCLNARQKNISPKIIISEEMKTDGVLFLIKALARELPLTLISPCDFLSCETSKEKFYKAVKLLTDGAEEI